MEPTRSGGALSDLARALGTPPPDHTAVHQRRTVRAIRSIAFDVAIILALGIAVLACIPLVIWLWLVVL